MEKKFIIINNNAKNTQAFTLRFLYTKLQTKKRYTSEVTLILSRFVKGGWVGVRGREWESKGGE